jgi:hypothetical protein
MSPVTVESSQPSQPAPPAQPATSNSGSNQQQQIRIAVLVILALVIGIVLWLVLGHHSKKPNKPQNLTKALGPWALSAQKLHNEAAIIGQPIYWAGPRKHVHYEFWRTTNNRIYIRYLPKGKHAGDPSTKYTIISTYQVPQAYEAVSKLKGAIKGPGGAAVWVRPTDPHSVLVAWPSVPFEVEVYDKNPANAASIAQSGQLTTVG